MFAELICNRACADGERPLLHRNSVAAAAPPATRHARASAPSRLLAPLETLFATQQQSAPSAPQPRAGSSHARPGLLVDRAHAARPCSAPGCKRGTALAQGHTVQSADSPDTTDSTRPLIGGRVAGGSQTRARCNGDGDAGEQPAWLSPTCAPTKRMRIGLSRPAQTPAQRSALADAPVLRSAAAADRVRVEPAAGRRKSGGLGARLASTLRASLGGAPAAGCGGAAPLASVLGVAHCALVPALESGPPPHGGALPPGAAAACSVPSAGTGPSQETGSTASASQAGSDAALQRSRSVLSMLGAPRAASLRADASEPARADGLEECMQAPNAAQPIGECDRLLAHDFALQVLSS